jgi:hypothetical protein
MMGRPMLRCANPSTAAINAVRHCSVQTHRPTCWLSATSTHQQQQIPEAISRSRFQTAAAGRLAFSQFTDMLSQRSREAACSTSCSAAESARTATHTQTVLQAVLQYCQRCGKPYTAQTPSDMNVADSTPAKPLTTAAAQLLWSRTPQPNCSAEAQDACTDSTITAAAPAAGCLFHQLPNQFA